MAKVYMADYTPYRYFINGVDITSQVKEVYVTDRGNREYHIVTETGKFLTNPTPSGPCWNGREHNFDRLLFGGGVACTVCDEVEYKVVSDVNGTEWLED